MSGRQDGWYVLVASIPRKSSLGFAIGILLSRRARRTVQIHPLVAEAESMKLYILLEYLLESMGMIVLHTAICSQIPYYRHLGTPTSVCRQPPIRLGSALEIPTRAICPHSPQFHRLPIWELSSQRLVL